jgi:hypothetical protein
MKLKNQRSGPKGAVEPVKKKKSPEQIIKDISNIAKKESCSLY